MAYDTSGARGADHAEPLDIPDDDHLLPHPAKC